MGELRQKTVMVMIQEVPKDEFISAESIIDISKG